MVDWRKAFNVISSWDHCRRSSSSWISDTSWAGFETSQNLSSGLVEWDCAIVATTTPRKQLRSSIKNSVTQSRVKLLIVRFSFNLPILQKSADNKFWFLPYFKHALTNHFVKDTSTVVLLGELFGFACDSVFPCLLVHDAIAYSHEYRKIGAMQSCLHELFGTLCCST